MKTLHVVFPRNYHSPIGKYFATEDNKDKFQVINYDNDINTFRHYMLINKEDLVIADIALLAIFENYEVPLEVQIKELIEKAVEVKIKHNQLRMILILPQSFKRDIKLVTDLVSIGIYDIHFKNEFDFEDITKWINEPLTLADMRDYIKANAKDPREFAALFGNVEVSPEIHEVEKTNTKIITQKETVEKIVRLTTTIEQKNIGVLALTKGAGATFHATNFASFLSSNDLNVGLYENPSYEENKTYLADVFNLFSEIDVADQKISVPHKIVRREEHYTTDTYKKNGIDIYATNYALGHIQEFESQHMMKYINTGKHSLKIIDLGCLSDRELDGDNFSDMLSLFNSLVVVVDLMPTSIIPHTKRLNKIRSICKNYSDMNLIFIINKFDGEIPQKKYKHLNLKPTLMVDTVKHSSVLQAMFQTKTIFDYDKTIREQLTPVYSNLAKYIELDLGEEKESKSNRLLSLFGR
jgi:hypothetical protein